MNTDEYIATPYGQARVAAKTPDGGFLVILRKDKMTTPHPNYRGGPCVLFIHHPRAKTELMGRVAK